MFAKRRQKPTALPPPKRRKNIPVQEISFDFAAREDYLTGFHKRKLQRIKRSQEEAVKKEREERIIARKQLREGRKADLEKHVEDVNAILKQQSEIGEDRVEEDEDVEGWGGIPEPEPLDHENEYEDEDMLTTVTIEAVDVSKDGLRPRKDQTMGGEDDLGKGDEQVDKTSAQADGKAATKPKRVWTKERPNGLKKKKKKFKYESRVERKQTRRSEHKGNRAAAAARKGP